jgi:hypothetical protein
MKRTEPLSVAIVYGFAEGKYHGRKLRAALRGQGLKIVGLDEADVILAHSAGCYLVPEQARAKIILHIGYTYWPGRKLMTSLKYLLAAEYHQYGLLLWLVRCAINDLYMLNLAQTIRTVRSWGTRGTYLDRHHQARLVFIRNRDDSYTHPDALWSLAGTNHTSITLPGSHNHIWDDPEPYVNLLKSVV